MIIDYLFAVNFHGAIVLLLDMYCENLCMETYKLESQKLQLVIWLII